MSLKSNVIIKSNVYVNKTKSRLDKDFIRQVRGYEALRKIDKMLESWQYGLLSKEQRKELNYGTPSCSLDKSGDKAWGTVIENRASIFICKCEKTDCKGWGSHKGYPECSKLSNFREIKRDIKVMPIEEVSYIPPDFGLLRYLDADDREVYTKITEKTSKDGYTPPEITVKQNTQKVSQLESKTTESVIEKENFKINLGGNQILNTETEKTFTNVIAPTPVKIIPFPKAGDFKFEYKRINTPDEIIESNIDDKIIVNAGPGTGKTYSVIKRLGYIINNDLADPTNVLVLCYSRSAVGVIKKRIKAEIDAGNISVEARQLFNTIRTFDSFVTYMLAEGELEGIINNLNYDERIEKFITELDKDKTVFDGLEYLIVDEMQDLVGVRARMVKAILEQIDCGFLLLGDVCQSIYDYQIQDESELNSHRYYKWLNSKFTTNVKRFELTKNVRQKKAMATLSHQLREAILSGDIDQQTQTLSSCVEAFEQENYIGNIRNLGNFDLIKSTGILCCNNAEVSIISTELFERDIEHCVAKRAQHIDLVPWIAEILSTYTENRIGKSAFIERAISAGYKDADDKWALLKTVANDDSENVLDIKLLIKSLVSGKELPVELDLASVDTPIVSTIHRAKGREYDNVLLISEDYNADDNLLDEIKVAYVALTRGKDNISFFSLPDEYNHNSGYFRKKYFDKVKRVSNENRGRFYAYMWNLKKKSKYPFCTNFELGLSGDVNIYSFVTKKYANEIQENIRKMKKGDILQAKYEHGHYWLYNVYDEIVGMLSDNVIADICSAMEEKNAGYRYHKNYQKPTTLMDIYVNNIVTIANTKFNEAIAEPYNKSGLWLGIEITGFAKTAWS